MELTSEIKTYEDFEAFKNTQDTNDVKKYVNASNIQRYVDEEL